MYIYQHNTCLENLVYMPVYCYGGRATTIPHKKQTLGMWGHPLGTLNYVEY